MWELRISHFVSLPGLKQRVGRPLYFPYNTQIEAGREPLSSNPTNLISTRRAPIDAIISWYKTILFIYFMTVIATCWEEAALLGARRSWAEGFSTRRAPIDAIISYYKTIF